MQGTLSIAVSTYFKSKPEDSKILTKEDLISLEKGQKLEIDMLGEANGHYIVLWHGKQGFVYEGHCAFVEKGGFIPLEACYLYLTKTTKQDSGGCYILELKYFKDGALQRTFDMRSGQPYAQRFRVGIESESGSMEPLPEGKWRINDIQWAGGKDNWDGSFSDGVGAAFVPLDYLAPGNTQRADVGMHYDANADYSWGSAGCAVVGTQEEMKQLVEVLRNGNPQYLYVDYELGSLKELKP